MPYFHIIPLQVDSKSYLKDVLMCYNLYFIYSLLQIIKNEPCSIRGSLKVCRDVFTWWFVDFAYCVIRRMDEERTKEQREQLIGLFYALGALFLSGRLAFHITLVVLTK